MQHDSNGDENIRKAQRPYASLLSTGAKSIEAFVIAWTALHGLHANFQGYYACSIPSITQPSMD